MRRVGNVIWFLFLGGFWAWASWLAVSLLCFVSIIGSPWGHACLDVAEFSASPFGREAIDRQRLAPRADIGTFEFGALGHTLWFLLLGLWLALAHLAAGLVCCATFIGIPFGYQHFKLALLAICPIGKTIVPYEIGDQVRRREYSAALNRFRANHLLEVK